MCVCVCSSPKPNSKRSRNPRTNFISLYSSSIYPKGSKLTKTTTKLQSLFDDPLVKKVIQDKSLGDEEKWSVDVWIIPAVSILTRFK